jgi:hypothetical protein
MSARIRITDGKGFGMSFANGWGVSVQFGYGNYADNYDGPDGRRMDDWREMNRLCGEAGSHTAECAVFDPSGEMIKELPEFMFKDQDYRDMVSNRSSVAQVLQLLNWAASQPGQGGEA